VPISVLLWRSRCWKDFYCVRTHGARISVRKANAFGHRSAVIDHLEHWKAATPNVGLAYIYCDFRDQALQTTENIIGAIAKQLLRQLPNPEEIATILKKSCNNKEHQQLVRKTKAFSDICNQFHRVFICLDALDECQEIPELLNCFLNVAMVRMFTTGRKFVQQVIETHFGPTPTIHIEAKESDIQVLVKERIREDRKKDPSLMNECLERYITEKVSALSKGMCVDKLIPCLIIHC